MKTAAPQAISQSSAAQTAKCKETAKAPREEISPERSDNKRVWTWLTKLLRFRLWRREKPARSAAPAFSKPLVQPELSLDCVRVVRNDLSDSDFDIVAVKPAAQQVPSTVPMVAAAAGTQATAKPWTKLTGRLFATGKH